MKIKAILSVLLVLVLAISLVGCGTRIKKDEAKETAEAFLAEIAKGDFESAKGYLHPEKPLNLEKYFGDKEALIGIDFQNGIEIKRYTSKSSALYDSEVDGSEYDLEANIIVDGVALEIDIEIVHNDLGYGIYSLDIDYND
jgi:uncharacterized protein YceK